MRSIPIALIDKVGPCILLGWSTGTSNVMNAAAARTGLVKGVIGIEGAPPTWPAATQAFTDQLKALGDDASTIWLADVGVHGNGHTMMLERNNEQIADLIEDWIVHHEPKVRGQ